MDPKLFEGKMGITWATKLAPIIQSPFFDRIFEQLRACRGEVVPESKNTFRAFRECPYNDLKAVMILQGPYHNKIGGVVVADGIPMSCSNTGVLQPSLDQYYNAVEDDIKGELDLSLIHNPDLTFLANQGVLMLNCELTTLVGKPKSHLEIWRPFIEELIEFLNSYNRGLVFLLLGSVAQELEQKIAPFTHYTLKAEHPAAAAYRGDSWKHEKVFSKCNTILKQNNGTEINWYQTK